MKLTATLFTASLLAAWPALANSPHTTDTIGGNQTQNQAQAQIQLQGQQQGQAQTATGGAGGSVSNDIRIDNRNRLQAPSVAIAGGAVSAPCQAYFNAAGSGPGFGFGLGWSRTVRWCRAFYAAEVLKRNYGLRAASLQILINEDPMVARALKGHSLKAVVKAKNHRTVRKASCGCR